MLKSRLLLTGISLMLLTTLTGCFDLLGFPNIGVSQDGTWVAYLAIDTEAEDDLYQLRAVNLSDGTIVSFSEPDQQGAFAWHPSENRIAYYNIGVDESITVRISGVDDPTTGEDIIGSFSFPVDFFVTQMAFSPDGTQLAMSVILSEEELFDNTEDSDTSTEIPIFDAAVYIANLSDGSITQVTAPGEFFPSIVTWSPTGSYLAFLAWTDVDGDGLIDISGEGTDTGGDATSVSVYEVATGTVTTAGDGASTDLSPTWLSDTTLAYIALNLTAATPDEGFFLRSYDATTITTTDLATFPTLGVATLGISASPDGSQLAFVGLGLDEAESSEDTPPPPADVYVFDIASGEAEIVYEYSFNDTELTGDSPVLDVPVWTQDGKSLIVASGNPLSSILFSFGAGFDSESSPEDNIPYLPIIMIDIETGAATTVVNEPVGSSTLLQALIPLATSMDDLEFE